MRLLKNANLALAFLLELAMLAALGYCGFQTGSNLLWQLILGIGLPIITIVIWGLFMAPKSERRLTGTAYLLLASIIFGLAALALIAAGQPILGVILAVLFVINHVLIHVWHQQ